MKKLLLILLLPIVIAASCKKENAPQDELSKLPHAHKQVLIHLDAW